MIRKRLEYLLCNIYGGGLSSTPCIYAFMKHFSKFLNMEGTETMNMNFSLSPEFIYNVTLLAFIVAGGFIGEFHRHNTQPVPFKVAAGNFLAGVFLSWSIASVIVIIMGKKTIVQIIGGLISFNDIKFIKKIARSLLVNILKESEIIKDIKLEELEKDEGENKEDEKKGDEDK